MSRQQLTVNSTENTHRDPTKNDAETMRRTGSHSNHDINDVLRQTNQNSVGHNESIESIGPAVIVASENQIELRQ